MTARTMRVRLDAGAERHLTFEGPGDEWLSLQTVPGILAVHTPVSSCCLAVEDDRDPVDDLRTGTTFAELLREWGIDPAVVLSAIEQYDAQGIDPTEVTR